MRPPSPALDSPVAKAAELVFIGEIRGLGAPPTFISGEMPATQDLELRVQSCAKGDLQPGRELRLPIVVVGGSEGVSKGPSGLPALDPAWYSTGRLLLVHALRQGEGFVPVPRRGAVVPAEKP